MAGRTDIGYTKLYVYFMSAGEALSTECASGHQTIPEAEESALRFFSLPVTKLKL